MTKKLNKKEKRIGKGPEPVTLLVVVGCGGGMYHGLPRLVTWCHRRGNVRVLLMDPDRIEERNATRQWGIGAGKLKVDIAAEALASLGVYRVHSSDKGVIDKDTLHSFIMRYQRSKPNYARIVVCNGPDNHKTRMDVHEGCNLLAAKTGVEVFEIVSGNTANDGYAYGCIHIREWVTRISSYRIKCVGDWLPRHPDIAEEAENERQGLAQPEGCGALAERTVAAGEMEQTVTGNQLTALCEWDLAEAMVAESMVGEILWVHEYPKSKAKGRRLTSIYTNLKPR